MTFGKTFAGLSLAGLAVTAMTAPGVAQDAPPPINNGSISLSGGADLTTAYFFRGILQEDSGFIIQPYAEIGINAYEGTGSIQSVDIALGTWLSIHEEQTGAAGNTGAPVFYETDYYLGVSVAAFDVWSFGAVYTNLTSPNDAFASVQEIGFSASYDDSDLFGEQWAINPTVDIVFETSGSTAGLTEGVYLQFSGEWSYDLVESEDYPIALSVPLVAGFDLDNQYYGALAGGTADDFFGFFSVGALVSTDLPFIPAEYGSWSVYAGPTIYFFGSDLEAANNGDDWEIVGTLGFSFAY
ncbi:MAG: hypothetical protein AAGG38_06025 [Planctomycetota bacterium]